MSLPARTSTPSTGLRRRVSQLAGQNLPLGIAVVIVIAMAVAYGALYAGNNPQGAWPGPQDFTRTMNTALPLVFGAVGQGFVVLTGGIDLSIGAQINLTNALLATHVRDNPASMALWVIITILAGTACGLLNGVLVAYGRLQPIIVTVGTMSIFNGIAIKILPQPGGEVPESLSNAMVNPNQMTGLIWIVAVILLWLLIRRTRLGVGLYAIGNDERAAKAMGMKTRRLKVSAYAMGGTMAGVAGVAVAAYSTSGDAHTGDSYTLTTIAAVVIGGISFMGGRGTIIGAILGAFSLTVLVNVLFFAKINPQYQMFYQGLFLILAVVIAAIGAALVRRTQS